MAPKEPMTLYYHNKYPNSKKPNSSKIETKTTLVSAKALNHCTTFFMCKSDFITPTTDICNIIAYRMPGVDVIGLPSTFLETVTITSKPYQSENGSNMITATANYVDNGAITSITTVDHINYTVTGASGKFTGYKNMKIIFDKDRIKRTVILS
jgi:hypothetical protein